MAIIFPYNYLKATNGYIPIFTSRSPNKEYPDTLQIYTNEQVLPYMSQFVFGDKVFEGLTFVEFTGGSWQLKTPYADGMTLVTLRNGYSIRLKWATGRNIGVKIYNDTQGTMVYETSINLSNNVGSYLSVPIFRICRWSDNTVRLLQPARISPTEAYIPINASEDLSAILGVFELTDPYATDDNNTPAGGYGNFDYTSEDETPPQLPTLSAAQVGFVSLWNPTQAEMQSLANYLWTGAFDLTNFKKLFTDPMECVLSVGVIPITPSREASKREIVFGGSSHSGVNAYAVTDQFYIVDMGALHIGGMSNGALDYSPYAKASIYLPYCGTYALDVDEIMDSDISLEYHIDIYTGACVAYLTINGHLNSDGHNVNAVMYQFTGNVLASIPITGNDHSQFIQSMLFMGAAAAATVATSGAGAGAAASTGADLGAETAATGFNKALAGSAVNTVMSMKPNVLHSGNLSTTAGMLGGQKPFITMTWSNLCRPEDENKLVGLPLHKSGTLSDFKGFTIVSACHMDNILCTDAELLMIEQALAKGVIL